MARVTGRLVYEIAADATLIGFYRILVGIANDGEAKIDFKADDNPTPDHLSLPIVVPPLDQLGIGEVALARLTPDSTLLQIFEGLHELNWYSLNSDEDKAEFKKLEDRIPGLVEQVRSNIEERLNELEVRFRGQRGLPVKKSS